LTLAVLRKVLMGEVKVVMSYSLELLVRINDLDGHCCALISVVVSWPFKFLILEVRIVRCLHPRPRTLDVSWKT
jgi:hypothetical protein